MGTQSLRPDHVDRETLKKVRPSIHVGLPLNNQHGSYGRVPARKHEPIFQELSDPKANLGRLVSRCQALDLANKPCLPDAPANIEIRVACTRRQRFDAMRPAN